MSIQSRWTTQGTHWTETHRNTHKLVAELLGEQPHAVGITMRPDDPEFVAALDAVMRPAAPGRAKGPSAQGVFEGSSQHGDHLQAAFSPAM